MASQQASSETLAEHSLESDYGLGDGACVRPVFAVPDHRLDFGDASTDSDGHIFKAKYALSKKIFLGGSLFINNVDRFQGPERDYNRLQLDVEFKFN